MSRLYVFFETMESRINKLPDLHVVSSSEIPFCQIGCCRAVPIQKQSVILSLKCAYFGA